MQNNDDSFREMMVAWRKELHMHPETAFKETRTAAFVADRLAECRGIEVHRNVTGTGVIGLLRCGNASRAVALRADMDALPIVEGNTFSHRSRNEGSMHACGHDGHMAMLLGAARRLAETRSFDGAIVFVFQPGEENAGGARRMLQEGLLQRFPVDGVFGLHNMPGMPAGAFATRVGPVMAAIDTFEIEITGKGTHAALPHVGIDPIVVAAETVVALQTIVSRNIDPLAHAIVSATQIQAGDTWNVIPEKALVRGCTRFFREDVGNELARAMSRIVAGMSAAYGAAGAMQRYRGYPPLVNAEGPTAAALDAAAAVAVRGQVDGAVSPVMASEDFAYLAAERPGCFMFIGNGDENDQPMVHSPHYDFNDDILTTGASYWIRLVERLLPAAAGVSANGEPVV